MYKNLILPLVALVFMSSNITAQLIYDGPKKDFITSSEPIQMPENSFSGQFDNLHLSARTEVYLQSNPNYSVSILVQIRTSATYSPEGDMAEYVSTLRASREALIEDLNAETGMQIDRVFKYTPYVSMFAQTGDIAKIVKLANVVQVIENEAYEPHLDLSTIQVGADVMQAQGFDGTGCTIAILDSGIDPNHLSFTGNVVASGCFNTNFDHGGGNVSVTNCPNGLEEQIDLSGGAAGQTCPDLPNGCFHGNHVAGIAATAPAAVFGVNLIGVAPGANLIGLNVFSTFNAPLFCGGPTPCILSYNTDQLAALEWVFDNYQTYNICSANMSLGGGMNTTACDGDARAGIIQMLRDAGVATTISSGNSGFSNAVGAPGCITAAVTVGSVSRTDVPSGFSNYGPGLVDLLAPGEGIRSAYGLNPIGSPPGHYFTTATGTSMSAPHVAGAFAILKAAFPDATVDEIEENLKVTGVPTADGPRIDIAAAYARIELQRMPVPTLGEWGVIVLGLMMCSIGLVAIRQRKLVLQA